MWKFIRQWLGLGEQVDVSALIKSGASILDVRTVEEFNEGHVEGSNLIPLHQLDERIDEIRNMDSPVIACCRTGRRSGIAARKLRKKGIESYNGGGWKEVQKMINT